MKNMYLRTCVALACALGLNGCGGGDEADLLVQVRSITNITKDGLVLKLNGGPERAVPANTTVYNFPELIARDTNFEITIVKTPLNVVGSPETTSGCVIFDGKGKTGSISPQTIRIECTLKTYALGGTVTGLGATNTGLILNNGSIQKAIDAGSTTFTMTAADGKIGKIPEDFSYGVTVFQQPAGKTCSVSNGTGIMPARDIGPLLDGVADPKAIKITCV